MKLTSYVRQKRDEGVFVVALMKEPSRILLQLRKNTGLHDGKFAFPGGKPEGNETWIETAIRELFEETGLEARKDRLIELRQYHGQDQGGIRWHCTFYIYHLDPRLGNAQIKEPNKHERLEWYSMNKLPRNLAPGMNRVISDLKSMCCPKEASLLKRCIEKLTLRNQSQNITNRTQEIQTSR